MPSAETLKKFFYSKSNYKLPTERKHFAHVKHFSANDRHHSRNSKNQQYKYYSL